MPAYRYVPGAGPHPFRAANGHRHAPPITGWHPDLTWRDDARWLHGLDLFDLRYPWECHELLEHGWLQMPKDSPKRMLWQAIILGAAAGLKRHMGHQRAADRLHTRALNRLSAAGRAHRTLGGLHLGDTSAAFTVAHNTGTWARLPGAYPS